MTASGRWCAAAKAAGIAAKVCCHTCRGSGITAYLENGGTLVGQSSVTKSYELQSQNTAASGRTRYALRGRSRWLSARFCREKIEQPACAEDTE